MKKLNVLLLCNRPVKNADASTVSDHIDALSHFSKHYFYRLSFVGKLPKYLDLRRFDVIVIHYTIAIGFDSEHYINMDAKNQIQRFPGLKVVFLQDEYRNVNKVIAALKSMKIDVLFTTIPDDEVDKVYSPKELPLLKKINNLTGYVPRSLLKTSSPQIKDRSIDVGYRARKLPYWLGELGFEKWQIAENFIEYSKSTDLRLDISCKESDRIYGKDWIDFVSSCKVMLGVESGSSVFDFNGKLQEDVDRYQAEHPDASFTEIQHKFLRSYEGKIRINQISPRCFEAAALRTVMLLYEGHYSGILKPWRHYVPLKKDFSNFADVYLVLKDDKKLQAIADFAFNEIALNSLYSYEKFVGDFDQILNREMATLEKPNAPLPYNKISYFVHLFISISYALHRISSLLLQRLILGTYVRRVLYDLWDKIPFNIKPAIRPFLRLIGR